MIDYKHNTNPVCIGSGLLALDVILNGSPATPPKFNAGGSCGNVLTILSFLDWNAFPIARLADNKASQELLNDLNDWNVNTGLISSKKDGSTPIIIHRILNDRDGKPKHKFEFRDPFSGAWLPRYKPVLARDVEEITRKQPFAHAFYFDRANRASIELAKYNKKKGAVVIYEPSSIKDLKFFKEALEVSHILKFSNERIKNYQEIFPNQQTILEIETLGKKGLRYRFDKSLKAKEWKTIVSYKLDEALIKDSAGAGDWCTAGIISQLSSIGADAFINMESSAIEHALQYGQALGAINCCFDGARGIMYNINRTTLDKALFCLQNSNGYLLNTILKSTLTNKFVTQKLFTVASLF